MPMKIHVISEIDSKVFGKEGSVLDDLLAEQFGKFIISKEDEPRLIVFPDWKKHIEVVREKLDELRLPGYHGAGKLYVSSAELPIDPDSVSIAFGSSTFEEVFHYDRPSDEQVRKRLLREGQELIAQVLTSVQTCRNDNDASDERRRLRGAG